MNLFVFQVMFFIKESFLSFPTSTVVLSLLWKMKNCQTTGIPGTQGAFSDKETSDIDGFTDEPVAVVQCEVQVAENTFVDDSK